MLSRAEISLSSRCAPKGRSVGSPPRSLGTPAATTIPSSLGYDTARRNSDRAAGQALLLHGAGTKDSN